MKSESIVARRAGEIISLSDLQRTYDPNSTDGLSLGGEIDDNDRVSKGSSCCSKSVYTTEGTSYCSKCGEVTQETFEDDDEYLDRIASEQAEREEFNDELDEAFDQMEEGGY